MVRFVSAGASIVLMAALLRSCEAVNAQDGKSQRRRLSFRRFGSSGSSKSSRSSSSSVGDNLLLPLTTVELLSPNKVVVASCSKEIEDGSFIIAKLNEEEGKLGCDIQASSGEQRKKHVVFTHSPEADTGIIQAAAPFGSKKGFIAFVGSNDSAPYHIASVTVNKKPATFGLKSLNTGWIIVANDEPGKTTAVCRTDSIFQHSESVTLGIKEGGYICEVVKPEQPAENTFGFSLGVKSVNVVWQGTGPAKKNLIVCNTSATCVNQRFL